MAKPNVAMEVSFPELLRLKKAFENFRPSLARKHLGAAIRRSLAPGVSALKSTTPKGPTGNLRRAIASKVKTYRTGNAVGLVGYTAAGSGKSKSAGGTVKKGKDRAYHMGFLEFGTKDRRTKGPIASSFKRLGPFTIKPVAKRGQFAGVARIRTSPAYPKAFFKRAPKGQGVFLSSMPIGGSSGQPPVRTAYQRALPEIRALLPIQMTNSLQKAMKDLADQFPRKYGPGGSLPATPF
jgi:hypothetical protein